RDDWLVACNGLRTAIDDHPADGTRTHHWIASDPTVLHVASVTASDYIEFTDSYAGIPVHNFAPPNLYNDALIDLGDVPFMMQVFSNHYGMYPFEKYGNTIVPMQTFGAMEHQTITTLGATLIDGQHGGAVIIAHELAHQWFGNCVTPLTWKDVWLSEGFATYSEQLYVDEWQGADAAAAYRYSNIIEYYKSWSNNAGPQTIYDPVYNMYFAPPQYEKAASVLLALRCRFGEQIFDQILQTYLTTYYNGWSVTEEFKAVCEQVSGCDLTQFFQQWIYGSGLPSVECALFFDGSNMRSYVKTGSNTATDFYLHIPVHLYTTAGEDSVLIEGGATITQTDHSTQFTDVNSAVIDPNHWILTRNETLHTLQINQTYAADSQVVLFWDSFWDEVPVESYSVYRALAQEGPYQYIGSTNLTSFADDTVTNNQTYYYRITAVIGSFESLPSDVFSATPSVFPLDQGILVVDETADGNGMQGLPNDIQVDDFYEAVIPASNTTWDFIADGAPTLTDLAQYSTVIWHDDDISFKNINVMQSIMTEYLIGGGNLIISGWKTANYLDSTFRDFLLGGQEVQISTVADFDYGEATGLSTTDIVPDPNKLPVFMNGLLQFGLAFEDYSDPIYNYHSNAAGSLNGFPCGIKAEPAGTLLLLGFPLYFMTDESANMFFDDWLPYLGEDVSITPQDTPSNPHLGLSVWPNPMTSSTGASIRLSLPEKTRMSVGIYNIRGQLVARIADRTASAGNYTLFWNGRNDNNLPISSGIYFVQIKTPAITLSKKLLLIR
ncbi:MAG: T9SS type A sorting domain-containing protein, partial [Candidatus Cloacimonetes bacterium]|nr:T9SS type A sorting domain-containing protein [Candidatus Cloacimonadota bacterium]